MADLTFKKMKTIQNRLLGRRKIGGNMVPVFQKQVTTTPWAFLRPVSQADSWEGVKHLSQVGNGRTVMHHVLPNREGVLYHKGESWGDLEMIRAPFNLNSRIDATQKQIPGIPADVRQGQIDARTMLPGPALLTSSVAAKPANAMEKIDTRRTTQRGQRHFLNSGVIEQGFGAVVAGSADTKSAVQQEAIDVKIKSGEVVQKGGVIVKKGQETAQKAGAILENSPESVEREAKRAEEAAAKTKAKAAEIKKQGAKAAEQVKKIKDKYRPKTNPGDI